MKAAPCKAFCDELDVRPVGAGLVVSTPSDEGNGERFGFTSVRDAEDPTLLRLEDVWAPDPQQEAIRNDFETDIRQAALTELLAVYRASWDADFAATLLRLRDFELLAPVGVREPLAVEAHKQKI